MPTDDSRRRPSEKLALIFACIMQIRPRAAVMEGKDPRAEDVITRATIDGFREFIDDTDPRVDHLREQFWDDIERNVTRLGLRVDQALRFSDLDRRQAIRSRLRLIEGDRLG